MHSPMDAQILLFLGRALYGQGTSSKFTPEPTEHRVLSHARGVEGIYRQLDSGLLLQ